MTVRPRGIMHLIRASEPADAQPEDPRLSGLGARRAPLIWGDLMSQLVVTSYGDPRESVSLGRAPSLLLGTDDILVEMEAAPVNPSDFLLVRGDYGCRPG